MLLFITGEDLRDYIGGKFQYISCYSLSRWFFNICNISIVSIHLMLLFIIVTSPFVCTFTVVSIHLMLLFIKNLTKMILSVHCFNTSHVTLYLAAPLATIKYCLVSIHLMLLFILYGYGRMEATTEFQYISYYSLSRKGMGYGTSGMRVSIHLMLLFILLGACNMFLSFCFNTSHVTLYRKSCCLSDARG